MTHHLSSDDDGGDFFFDKPPEPRHRYPTNTTSRSPHRPRHRHNNHKSPKRNTMTTSPKRQSRSPKRQSKSPKRNKAPADMTVICHRVFLFDNHNHNNNYCRKQQQQQQQYCETNNSDDDNNHHYHHNLPHPNLPVAPYDFVANETTNEEEDTIVEKQRMMKKHPCPLPTVAVIRAPQQPEPDNEKEEGVIQPDNRNVIMDSSIPNPHDPSVVHDKYWAQRRRLFSNFDMGIQLDAEGWYSVTPETIANHVAQRLVSTYTSSNNNNNLIVMDAFCGCGGNAIAFGRNPHIALVVCVDVDRTKLRMAAYNACLYGIPKEKILFVECTSLFVLQHCYFDGQLRLDRLPPHHAYGGVETEVSSGGFFIGGLGLLPSRIDAVFMDPPWGGVDYNSLGKNGYCLEKHMKILKWQSSSLEDEEDEDDDDDDDEQPEEIGAGLGDDFFDSFGTTTHHHHNNNKNKKKKKNSSFNQKQDESEYWNGVDLLQVAASSTKNRWIIYDLPRNTSKTSLAKCALAAGYRGNVKLEEHYLNGRLKTVTAYLGIDHTPMLTTTTTTTNNSSNSQQEA